MGVLAIVNADDFGWSLHVNQAVRRAHEDGVLTTASLMVAEPAFDDAVSIARRLPNLGVGLHVSVSYDRALLDAGRLPTIAPSGWFGRHPVRTGLLYMLSGAARQEIVREVGAQFDRFASTGLAADHADGHQHFHLHPAVWRTFLDNCDRHAINRLRIPNEPVREHLRGRGSGPNANTAALLAIRALHSRNLAELRRRGTLGGRPPFIPDRCYGQLQTGDMNARYLVRLAARLSGPVCEVYLHPGAPHAERLPGGVRIDGVADVELDALLNPATAAAFKRADVRLATYREAEEQVRAGSGA